MNPIITVMLIVQVQYCGVNDSFWIPRATPSCFSGVTAQVAGRSGRALRPERPCDPANPGAIVTGPHNRGAKLWHSWK